MGYSSDTPLLCAFCGCIANNKAYNPDSLINVAFCVRPRASLRGKIFLSSESMRPKLRLWLVSLKIIHTSLPTNQGSPSISTVLRSPNSGWLNTVGASVDVDASERWGSILIPHHYVHFSKDVDSFYSLNVFPPHTKGMSICDTPSFVTKEECLFHSPTGRDG